MNTLAEFAELAAEFPVAAYMAACVEYERSKKGPDATMCAMQRLALLARTGAYVRVLEEGGTEEAGWLVFRLVRNGQGFGLVCRRPDGQSVTLPFVSENGEGFLPTVADPSVFKFVSDLQEA